MNASEAYKIATENTVFRQIRHAASMGRFEFEFEEYSREYAEKIKNLLIDNGYTCSKIKQSTNAEYYPIFKFKCNWYKGE